MHPELVSTPTLIVVSGPSGSGKTTLAHRLATEIGLPALCRDELKEGMVHSTPGFVATTSDPLTLRTYGLYFATIRLWLESGVSLVAEAAFQDRLWRQGLEPLAHLADLRIVRCHVAPATAITRATERMATQSSRAAHADAEHLARSPTFTPISMDAPTLDVDTSDGYEPDLATVAAFAVPLTASGPSQA